MLISILKISVSLVMNYSIQLAKIARHPSKRFVLKLRPPPPPAPSLKDPVQQFETGSYSLFLFFIQPLELM